MSGLERDFDKVDNQLVKIKEGLVEEGLFYKTEDNKQGFLPRAKNDDYWKFTEEQSLQSEKWVREAQRDYPKCDPTTIEFMVNFYIKYPDEYKRILKDKPESKVDTFEEMRKKYDECDKLGNKVYSICEAIIEGDELINK